MAACSPSTSCRNGLSEERGRWPFDALSQSFDGGRLNGASNRFRGDERPSPDCRASSSRSLDRASDRKKTAPHRRALAQAVTRSVWAGERPRAGGDGSWISPGLSLLAADGAASARESWQLFSLRVLGVTCAKSCVPPAFIDANAGSVIVKCVADNVWPCFRVPPECLASRRPARPIRRRPRNEALCLLYSSSLRRYEIAVRRVRGFGFGRRFLLLPPSSSWSTTCIFALRSTWLQGSVRYVASAPSYPRSPDGGGAYAKLTGRTARTNRRPRPATRSSLMSAFHPVPTALKRAFAVMTHMRATRAFCSTGPRSGHFTLRGDDIDERCGPWAESSASAWIDVIRIGARRWPRKRAQGRILEAGPRSQTGRLRPGTREPLSKPPAGSSAWPSRGAAAVFDVPSRSPVLFDPSRPSLVENVDQPIGARGVSRVNWITSCR